MLQRAIKQNKAHKGLLRKGGSLFMCLGHTPRRCFRPMHKDLPRVVCEIFDVVLVKKWKKVRSEVLHSSYRCNHLHLRTPRMSRRAGSR